MRIAKINGFDKMNKKGYFFIIDSVMGVAIMIAAVTYLYNIHSYEQPKNQLFMLTDNLMNFIATTKIATLNNPYSDYLQGNGNITNNENTILEQINEFFYREKNGCIYCRDISTAFLVNMTDGIIETQYNFKISLNNETIYEKSKFSETKSLLTLKTGKIVYTFINGTILYGPSYAEVVVWQ